MQERQVRAILGGLAALLLHGVAAAQCTKDTECKGDRVCDAGKCTSPLPAAPPPPPGPAAAPPPAGEPSAAPAGEPAAAAVAPPPAAQPVEPRPATAEQPR